MYHEHIDKKDKWTHSISAQHFGEVLIRTMNDNNV